MDDVESHRPEGGPNDSGRPSQLLNPGNVLGQYRIVEIIATGGMGTVYRAEHVRLGRTVALKVLKEEFGRYRELLSRFVTEARAVNAIDHENLLEITDVAEEKASGLHYIVMEHLRGRDLRDLIEAEGALPLERCLAIARQVAGAAHAAHQVGIVHRDLKPGNIFLVERRDGSDFVKILDFGIAKVQENPEIAPIGLSTHMTTPGMMLGTPTYASPEQACGKPVDHRTDIYSLGCILYEMLTGAVPFEGRTAAEIVGKKSYDAPPRPSEHPGARAHVPPRLERLVTRCLAAAPEDRPASMAEVQAELAAVAESSAARDRRPPGEAPRRHGAPAIALWIVTALLCFAGGAASQWLLSTMTCSPAGGAAAAAEIQGRHE
jgi:serine/threonine-protein kinase